MKPELIKELESRMDYLMEPDGDDDVLPSEASLLMFWLFILGLPRNAKKPQITFSVEGEICAYWGHGTGRKVSIQFRVERPTFLIITHNSEGLKTSGPVKPEHLMETLEAYDDTGAMWERE